MELQGSFLFYFCTARFQDMPVSLGPGELLFVCLLGGMYNFIGPIVGSFIFLFLHQIITRYTEYWPIILGFGIVLISLFFRGGVVGFVIQKMSHFTVQERK